MRFAYYESIDLLNKINCGLAPPERLTTSEWAEKYFQLPPTSAKPGNWYRDHCPPQQGINHHGERIKRGIKLYAIRVDLAKETLYARSRIDVPGAKFLNVFKNSFYSCLFRIIVNVAL